MLLEQRGDEVRIDANQDRDHLEFRTIVDPHDFTVTLLLTGFDVDTPGWLTKCAIRMTQEQYKKLKETIK